MLVNLNQVLHQAKLGKYAVGLFNTTDTTMLQAVIETAEELRSPVIIGTAEVLLPYGSLPLLAPSIISMASNATVPVVVHYDHGLTHDKCIDAMDRGFSSIMYDCSTLSMDDNIAKVKAMADIAHSRGCSIEGEIGHVGGNEADSGGNSDSSVFTTIEQAVMYANSTNVDALAIAVGSAHGAYKLPPQLDFDRIADIAAVIGTPLVLHGGSGLSDSDFTRAIQCGISKVNVFTDLCLATDRASKHCVEHNIAYLDRRNITLQYIKQEVANKMKLFGCCGKA